MPTGGCGSSERVRFDWERIDLWEDLLASLPKDCMWFFYGDWNAIESTEDKSTSYGKIMSDVESLIFQQLKSALKIEDIFFRTSPIKFSWDNKRRDEVRVLARLDRITPFWQLP
jgi:hypothetical protein